MLLVIVGFIAGIVFGSFANVVILRFKRLFEEDSTALSYPRSQCPHCGYQLRWFNLIPLISYLIQRGKCTSCKATISPQYPIIEGLIGCLFAYSMSQYGLTVTGIAYAFFFFGVVILGMVDLRYYLLPTQLSQALLWLGLLQHSITSPDNLKFYVFGAMFGYLIFWLIKTVFQIVRKKEGLGAGDLPMSAMAGAWFGIAAMPYFILLSSALGLLIAAIRYNKRGRTHFIPFGSAMALAIIIMHIYLTAFSNI